MTFRRVSKVGVRWPTAGVEKLVTDVAAVVGVGGVVCVEDGELKGIQWKWLSVEGAMKKSPLGGEKTGSELVG